MPTLELPALYIYAIQDATAPHRPVLINRDPGPGEDEVPLDEPIRIDMVDPGSDGIDLTKTRIWVDDVLAFDGQASPTHQPGYDGPRARHVSSADTLHVVLDPAVSFRNTTSISVRVVTQTAVSSLGLDETYTFTTEDRTAPQVLGAIAVGPRRVRIGFNEEVVVTDPLGWVFESVQGPAVSVRAIDAVAEGAAVNILLDINMTPNRQYRVYVTGAADRNGNAVSPFHNNTVFFGYRPPHPQERRFDLWTMLPQHNRRDDVTGDLRRFVDCLQEVLDLQLAEIDRFTDIFDVERAPEAFVDVLLKDLGNPFQFELDELSKRRLASVLVEMYRQKGTAIGIRNAVRFFLGIDVVAIRSFVGATLILGESQLGVSWELGPSNRFARYAFNVEVDSMLTEVQRRQIRVIVDYLKPAHTHFINLVEPHRSNEPDSWELGISPLGEKFLSGLFRLI